VRIAVDTNILLRDALHDDLHQARLAARVLQGAEVVAITLTALCEFVWVLRQGYKKKSPEIAEAIRRLVQSANVVTNRPAVEAGLQILEEGGDFADGVIAYEGRWLGSEEFVSFDRQAIAMVKAQGHRTRLLS
jgi:predicted nucleic-acid-binding protein